jgi:hypothetical protein
MNSVETPAGTFKLGQAVRVKNRVGQKPDLKGRIETLYSMPSGRSYAVVREPNKTKHTVPSSALRPF